MNNDIVEFMERLAKALEIEDAHLTDNATQCALDGRYADALESENIAHILHHISGAIRTACYFKEMGGGVDSSEYG